MRFTAARVVLLGSCAVILAIGSQASAQSTTTDDGGAAEIVVTANKREQSINDVGLAISAVTADTLARQNVVTLADIANVVPGLSYTPSATLTPVYTLRGVGFYESTFANYPATSVYVDEVPLAFPILTSHANFDLERIEVLKGPQGTLYGQNSTGGAINFVVAKPTDTAQAGGDLTFGRFSRAVANAYISGPITDRLLARVAATGAIGGDWQKSYTRNDSLGETAYFAARLLLDWKPTDRLSLDISFNGWQDQSDPQAPQYQTLLSQSPTTTVPELRAYPFAPFNARAADWGTDNRPHANNRMLQGAVRATYDISDSVSFVSLTSYADFKANQGFETDGTTIGADDIVVDDGTIKSFNQEVRLTNGGKSPVRWIVGANYERSKVYQYQEQSFPQTSTAPIFGYTGDYIFTDQKMRNYAAFGNVEADVGKLTLKAGARYTKAKRSTYSCNGDRGDGTFAAVFDGLVNAIQLGFYPVAGFTPTGIPVPPIGTGCAALDNITSDGTPATYLPGPYIAKLNEDNVSWRVGVDFKPNRDLLLYANVAKGYKAGSFPLASAATQEQFVGITQESLLDYEAGIKLDLFDRRVSVNAGGFYYDYKDKQLRSKLVDPIFGVLDFLQNIPKSRMIGGELDIVARPARGLTLSFSGAVLDSKITEFVGFSFSGISTDFSGAPIPYTPKYQGRVSLDYEWSMGDVMPFVGATVSARSHAWANIGGSRGIVPPSDFASSVPFEDIYRIPGYTLVDLRAGVRAADDRWSVSLFGKNVFNEYYLTNIFTDYDTVGRYSGQPATYGVTLAIRLR